MGLNVVELPEGYRCSWGLDSVVCGPNVGSGDPGLLLMVILGAFVGALVAPLLYELWEWWGERRRGGS